MKQESQQLSTIPESTHYATESPARDDNCKYDLLSKLNDMKTAIDSYKEYKTRQQNEAQRSTSQHNRTPTLSTHRDTVSSKNLFFDFHEAPPCQIPKFADQRPIISPLSCQSEEFIFSHSQKCEEQASLQQYLGFNAGEKIAQESTEVQCDLDKNEILELKVKHDQQLDLFDSQINQLRESVQNQQSREQNLIEAISLMQGEIEILKQSKVEAESREEELMKQSEELIAVVEEQTESLKQKDQQIEQLLEVEQKYYDKQQVVSNVSSPRIQDVENRQLQEKNFGLQEHIEELQEKLAIEFNKKRKLKSDYDDQIVELNEELEYYKDKYNEMKTLLDNCREQLKQFEELNNMRNDVIEKLETENKMLKQSQSVLNGSHSARKSCYSEQLVTEINRTPQRRVENSFSLHLHKVAHERSSEKSSFARALDFGFQGTDRKKHENSCRKPPVYTNDMIISPTRNRSDGGQVLQSKYSTTTTTNVATHHDSITCIEENVLEENQDEGSFREQRNFRHKPSSSINQFQINPAQRLSNFLSPQVQNRTEQNSMRQSMNGSMTNESMVVAQRREDYGKENQRVLSIDVNQGYNTANKMFGERKSIQYEQQQRPFRVLSSENRDYQFSERAYQYKKPFEYAAFQPMQNQINTYLRTQDSNEKQYVNKPMKTACFAHQDTLVEEIEFTQTNDSLNSSKPQMSAQKQNHQKVSIRDEIKKLHNNINSLRQKMCVNQTKAYSKNDSVGEKVKDCTWQYSKIPSHEGSTINCPEKV